MTKGQRCRQAEEGSGPRAAGEAVGQLWQVPRPHYRKGKWELRVPAAGLHPCDPGEGASPTHRVMKRLQ